MVLTVAGVVLEPHPHGLPAHRRELHPYDGQWRAIAIFDVVLTQQNSTFHPSRLPPLVPPSQHSSDIPAVAKEMCSLALNASTFFQRRNYSRWTDLQNSCGISDTTAIHRHITDLLLDFTQPSPVAKV